MTRAAYYNENDPKAAAWLRELIRRGLIADGDVDERSIRDVQGSDLAGYIQCHFFAGIGGWSHALRLAGWGDDRPVWTGSCPCQPFSVAGKRQGEKDDRHLWPDFRRLIAIDRPAKLFGEQVASKDGRLWLAGVRADLEELGYAVGAADLCAASVGAPHIRQRLWWVADYRCERCEDSREQHRHGIAQSGDEKPPSRTGIDCALGCLADSRRECSERRTDCSRSGGEDSAERQQAGIHDQRCGGTGALADAECDGGRLDKSRTGPQGGVADRRLAEGLPSDLHTHTHTHTHTQNNCRLGDTHSERLQEQCRPVAVQAQHEGAKRTGHDGGFWSDFGLVQCRDGKARRIEPGSFPLAHGIPARVGRLRGYGNAIVPQVAAEFIAACIDVISAC